MSLCSRILDIVEKSAVSTLVVGTLCYGVYSLSHLANSPDITLTDIGFPSIAVTAGMFLTIHHYQLKKIENNLSSDLSGKELSEAEVQKLRRGVVIGRTAHRIGSLLGYSLATYLIARDNLILGGLFGGLAGLVYEENVWKGYRDLYTTKIELLIGKNHSGKNQ